MRLLRRVDRRVTTEDVAWMNSLGYYGYLEWQLNHEAMGDPECEARLQPLTTINLAPLSLYNSDSAVVIRELTEATIITGDLLEPAAVRADGRVLDRPLQHQHHVGRDL